MLLFSSGSHKQTWRDDALVKDHRTIYTYETILFWLVLPQSQIVEFIFPPSLCNLASSIFFFSIAIANQFFLVTNQFCLILYNYYRAEAISQKNCLTALAGVFFFLFKAGNVLTFRSRDERLGFVPPSPCSSSPSETQSRREPSLLFFLSRPPPPRKEPNPVHGEAPPLPRPPTHYPPPLRPPSRAHPLPLRRAHAYQDQSRGGGGECQDQERAKR